MGWMQGLEDGGTEEGLERGTGVSWRSASPLCSAAWGREEGMERRSKEGELEGKRRGLKSTGAERRRGVRETWNERVFERRDGEEMGGDEEKGWREGERVSLQTHCALHENETRQDTHTHKHTHIQSWCIWNMSHWIRWPRSGPLPFTCFSSSLHLHPSILSPLFLPVLFTLQWFFFFSFSHVRLLSSSPFSLLLFFSSFFDLPLSLFNKPSLVLSLFPHPHLPPTLLFLSCMPNSALSFLSFTYSYSLFHCHFLPFFISVFCPSYICVVSNKTRHCSH